jgi:hypothetical protein
VVSLKIFPHMEATLSLSGTFLSFGLILVLFLPVIFFILPETKGRDEVLIRVFANHFFSWTKSGGYFVPEPIGVALVHAV